MTGVDQGARSDGDTDVDALSVDRYVEVLLATRDPRPSAVAIADRSFDEAIRRTADRLARDLVRVHPSFRFEERLAQRLRSTPAPGTGSRGSAGVVVAFEPPSSPNTAAVAVPSARESRPLVGRGSMASAAISLAGVAGVAGVALFAWRRGRPGRSRLRRGRSGRRFGSSGPWVRAVRAARVAVPQRSGPD